MKTKCILLAIRGLFLVALLWGGTAWAATTFIVDRFDDPNPPKTACTGAASDCSLRGAITRANTTPGDSIITLPAGPYKIQIVSECDNDNADGDLDVFASDVGMTLTINGAGAATTTIDGGNIDRVFDVPSHSVNGIFFAPTLTLNNLTIKNGTAHDDSGDPCVPQGDGGGIRAEALSTLKMNGVVVTENVAGGEGGGVANEDATVTINGSTVSGNNAGTNGGGLYNGSCPSLAVTNSTISGNNAKNEGGGVFTDCETSILTNTTVSGNNADANGGGVAVTANSIVILKNVTVTDNTADKNSDNVGGGGGIFVGDFNGSDAFMRNTIIAGNHDLSSGDPILINPDCFIEGVGSLTSEGFNLIGNDSGCTFTHAASDKVGTNASPINPRLGPLANNGGPTLTHALLTTPAVSPAIDAANPAGCFSNIDNNGSPLTSDQRGSIRPLDGGPAGPSPFRCDIGAFELGGCGDGFLDPSTEKCDDGNTTNNDGCSSTCQIESCGDGVVQSSEQCDDGNKVSGDGCSAVCVVETGFTCTGTPSVCTLGCGDGILGGSEQCDDGNHVSGDGCTSDCHTEQPTEPEGGGVCGNGIVESGETCDNGLTNGNEPNRACRTDCSAQRCGDNIVDDALGEECDGNRDDCDPATCTIDACTVIAADARNVVTSADLADFLKKYKVGLDGHSEVTGFEKCVILFSAGGPVNVGDIQTQPDNSAGCSLREPVRTRSSQLPLVALFLAPAGLLVMPRFVKRRY